LGPMGPEMWVSAMELNLPKGFSYVVAAVVIGLVATFGVHRYITAKTRVTPVVTIPVAVANCDVAPGTALTAEMVKISAWPKELVPAQAMTSLTQVQGRVVMMAISHGEPILSRKLAPEGTAAGLAGLLDMNKRALTVRVDDVSGVAGFIHPGDRVDVLADIKAPTGNNHFSRTILQNIVVLTTGQIWEQKGDNKPVVVNTVTLELSPAQAEIMNLASNEGKIRLALRNFRNLDTVETEGVETSQLIEGGGRKLKVAEAPSRKEERTVEVIKGLERSKITL
jgi:pilus assembly protein CpaB